MNRLNNKSKKQLLVYSQREFEILSKCINDYLGKTSAVLHEIIPKDIRVDILVSKPTSSQNYYVLTTCGLGAYKMNNKQNSTEDRVELVMFLAPDIIISPESWPVRLLKTLAHLPIDTDKPIGWGHSISLGNTFPEIKFQAILLSNTLDKDLTLTCTLSADKKVVFYRVLPIYENELVYKTKNGADALIDLLGTSAFSPINLKRKDLAKI